MLFVLYGSIRLTQPAMDTFAIIKKLEDLLLQFFLLAIYIPKTIFKILKDPAWVPVYVMQENKNESQYENYTSPIFLYLFTALIPYALFSEDRVVIESLSADRAIDNFVSTLEATNTLIRALILISAPLVFSFFIDFFGAGSLSRANIKRLLCIQCYYFTVFIFIIHMSYLFLYLAEVDGLIALESFQYKFSAISLNIIILLTALWLLFVQLRFLRNELEGHPWKIFLLLALSCALIFIFIDPITFKSGTFELRDFIGYFISVSILVLYGSAMGIRAYKWTKSNFEKNTK